MALPADRFAVLAAVLLILARTLTRNMQKIRHECLKTPECRDPRPERFATARFAKI